MSLVFQYKKGVKMTLSTTGQGDRENTEKLKVTRLLTAGLQVQVLPLEPFFSPQKQGFSDFTPWLKRPQLYPNCNRYHCQAVDNPTITPNRKTATGGSTPEHNHQNQ